MDHQSNETAADLAYTDSIVRAKDLKALDSLSDTERAREIKAGRYPAPFKLSTDPKSRAVGWSYQAIQKWIAERREAV